MYTQNPMAACRSYQTERKLTFTMLPYYLPCGTRPVAVTEWGQVTTIPTPVPETPHGCYRLGGVKGSVSSAEIERILGPGFIVIERMLNPQVAVVKGPRKPMLAGHCALPFKEKRESRTPTTIVMIHLCGWSGVLDLASAMEVLHKIKFPFCGARKAFVSRKTKAKSHREDTKIIYVDMDTVSDALSCLGRWDADLVHVCGRAVHVHCTQLAPREYNCKKDSTKNEIFRVPWTFKLPPLLEEGSDSESSGSC
eukprot:TRINITY_DN19631_c3_g1_i1.p1 TRINITY_DN19631_c3_g1~~TRINITY_DN19631_c3_g1_i1.p1  ORF type:complete len:259 (+),score=32.20 TRINITY_DN19631_c3_g1_i1:23-778(+)